MTGSDLIRRWERRFALTTEYAIKMGYARLIKMGTQSIYDAPLPVTAVVTLPAPRPDTALPLLKQLSALQGGGALVTVPRYEAFMTYAQGMSDQGVNFSEIAGNDSFILVSVLVPTGWKPAGAVSTLLAQPILTLPGTERVLLAVPVKGLAEAMRQWKAGGLRVEHVFDY